MTDNESMITGVGHRRHDYHYVEAGVQGEEPMADGRRFMRFAAQPLVPDEIKITWGRVGGGPWRLEEVGIAGQLADDPKLRDFLYFENLDGVPQWVRDAVTAHDPNILESPRGTQTAESPPRPLRWHYGPTEADPDPGKMWHYDCGGEVLGIENGYICHCGAQSDD